MSRILFTNSPTAYHHGHSATQKSWPTFILPYLCAIAGPKHEYHIHDHMTAKENLVTAVKRFKPDIIGFSIIASRDLWSTIKLIKQVKGCGAKLIAGGQAATTHSDNVLAAGVNTVFCGESEQTLNLIGDEHWDWQYQEGTVKRRDDCDIFNLDNAPFPRWGLMPLVKSRVFPDRYTGAIEVSRGCKNTCSYCAITAYWKGTFRQKSNDKIMDELERLIGMGRTHLYLADDNFGIGWEKHVKLYNEILRRKLDIKFFAQTRPQTIIAHPMVMKLAAMAGLYGVLVGYHNQEINGESADICRRYGIGVFESNIYGLPQQKSVWDYWPLFNNTRRNADIARFPMFSLLPGSKIGSREITANLLAGKEGDSDFRLPLRSKGARRTFQHGMLFWNIAHLLLDWYKCLRPGLRGVFARKDMLGIIRYWRGRLASFWGLTST